MENEIIKIEGVICSLKNQLLIVKSQEVISTLNEKILIHQNILILLKILNSVAFDIKGKSGGIFISHNKKITVNVSAVMEQVFIIVGDEIKYFSKLRDLNLLDFKDTLSTLL